MARLTKSKNRWIDGVIGGLGNYFQFNPDILRIAVLIGVFVLDFKFLIAAYFILMVVMPGPGKVESSEDDGREERFAGFTWDRGRSLQVVGILLILCGMMLIIKYQLPRIWYLFADILGSYQHFISSLREILIAGLLILGGCWILFKGKKRR